MWKFRYNRCQWTTGDITGSGGFGGSPAVAGFDAGTHRDVWVIPGSGTHDVLNLCYTSNVNQPGVWRFQVRSGQPAMCGDGRLTSGEECDWGASNSDTEPGACRTTCHFSQCGDGIQDGTEVCDWGENNSDAEPGSCRTNCRFGRCGDGIQDADEECDSGISNSNMRPGSCRETCRLPLCGDAVVDPDEECDAGFGNSNRSGTRCYPDCRLPEGASVVEPEPMIEPRPTSRPPETRPVVDVTAELGPAEDPDPVGPIDEELDAVWARRQLPILLNRRYVKEGRHSIALFGGIIPNEPFVESFPVGLRYDYFFTESLGIELDGAYQGEMFRADSDLTQFLALYQYEPNPLELQDWRAHLGLIWSPFYAKIAFLSQKLVHFDFSFYAGAGVVSVESAGEIRPEASLGAGVNFWLGRDVSLRLDGRQFLYESDDGGVSHPLEFSLGFGVFF